MRRFLRLQAQDRPRQEPRHWRLLPPAERTFRERRVAEDFLGWNNFGDVGNPYEMLFDGLRLIAPPLSWRWDRRGAGGSYLYQNESTLDLYRMYARWQWETNPYARGALQTLKNYVIGVGYKYTSSPRKYRDVAKGTLKRVDRFLDEFMEKNEWCTLEPELFLRQHRDGDAFLELHPQEDGVSYAQIVEPEQIRAIDKGEEEWAYGILCKRNDPSGITAFNKWDDPGQGAGTVVPARYMAFLRNHTDRNVKRGLSSFFPIREVLDDCQKLLSAGRKGESARQAIAYVRQWSAADQATVLGIQAAQTNWQEPLYAPINPTNPSPSNVNVVKVVGGMVEDIGPGQEYIPPPVGNAENMRVNVESSLKAAAVDLQMAPWMLTGEMTGNYASALVAESPYVKAMEYQQKWFSERFCAALMKVLQIGVDQGELPPSVLEDVRIETECPPIATRNKKEETAINEVLYRNGLLSARTWCARENLDYDKELDQIAQEPKPAPPAAGPQGDAPAGKDPMDYSISPSAEYGRAVDRPE